VYPEEVEAVVKSHPAVADAVVIGAADERWGEQVVAIVAPVESHPPPTLTMLQDHCRERLAGYKVPRALYVVESVPRTAAGKVDYAWARAVASPDR